MITIFAEKPDMGTKIAAALDAIHLENGQVVHFNDIGKHEKDIIRQRTKDGCLKIRFYNQDVVVTWGYGHMVGLKQAQDYYEEYADWHKIPLPYIPERYELKVITDNYRQFSRIQNWFKQSELIICATDDDREGDLIFDYIYTYLHCRTPFKRALFNKQSEDEFLKAFRAENLVDSWKRKNVIHAGRARSAGDFIVGAGPTVAMTLKYSGNGRNVLSVGRVQTAVLNMVVSRENDILSFKPQDYWVLEGTFIPESGKSYIGIHVDKKFDKKQDAEAVLAKIQNHNGIVISVEKKEVKKNKPNLYSLAALQIDSNKAFGFSLEETHKIAQSLYDKGVTTYPRTDSTHLPEDMKNEMESVFKMLKNTDYAELIPDSPVNYYTKQYFDNRKVNSHYAIVPTKKTAEGLTENETKVYDLIVRSVLTMLYPEAVFNKSTVVTEVNGEQFITHGNAVIDAGFMAVTGIPRDKLIPDIKQGEIVKAECRIETKQTEPPKRYTDATILTAMINCGKMIKDEELRGIMEKGKDGDPRGIGRPSSRDSIVSTLEKRGYTKKNGKSIYPTDKGMAMIKSFPVQDLKSAEMTAQWEKRLDDIEAGKDTYESFMSALEACVKKWTTMIIEAEADENLSVSDDINLKCPCCGLKMAVFSWGLGCLGYKDGSCKFSISNPFYKKKLSGKQITQLITTGETNVISGFVSKEGRKYSGRLVVNQDTRKVEVKINMSSL